MKSKTAWMCDDINCGCPCVQVDVAKDIKPECSLGCKDCKWIPVTILPTTEAKAIEGIIINANDSLARAMVTSGLANALARLDRVRKGKN